jgi:hypothetical protein
MEVLLSDRRLHIDQTTPIKISPAVFVYSENAEPLISGHDTALMYAVTERQTAAVRLLLAHKADIHVRNAQRLTALDQSTTADIRQLLLAAARSP